LVFNALTLKQIEEATAKGIKAALNVTGVVKISAVNFGGKLGPYQIKLREVLERF
jgi:formylmethanofuran--tetrahydromethanopterin N-formyltransferase